MMNTVSANLSDLTGKQLVAGFNAITGGGIKRFTSRADGIRRVAAALAETGKAMADIYAGAGVDMPGDPVAADIPGFLKREEGEDLAPYERRCAEERARLLAKEAGAGPSAEENQRRIDATVRSVTGSNAKTTKKGKARKGGNVDKVIDLMKRDSGATVAEMTGATGWLPHTLRAAISVQVKRKRGLTVERSKNAENLTVYAIQE